MNKKYGRIALDHAKAQNHLDIVKFLEEKELQRIEKEEIKEFSQLPNGLTKEQQIIEGSKFGLIYVIRKLLKEGINVNSKDEDKITKNKE